MLQGRNLNSSSRRSVIVNGHTLSASKTTAIRIVRRPNPAPSTNRTTLRALAGSGSTRRLLVIGDSPKHYTPKSPSPSASTPEAKRGRTKMTAVITVQEPSRIYFTPHQNSVIMRYWEKGLKYHSSKSTEDLYVECVREIQLPVSVLKVKIKNIRRKMRQTSKISTSEKVYTEADKLYRTLCGVEATKLENETVNKIQLLSSELTLLLRPTDTVSAPDVPRHASMNDVDELGGFVRPQEKEIEGTRTEGRLWQTFDDVEIVASEDEDNDVSTSITSPNQINPASSPTSSYCKLPEYTDFNFDA